MEAKQEKTLAMFCHLGSFAGFLIPFGHIIAPLVIWLVKKNESELVDKEGKKSLNFQISLTLYSIVAGVLCLIFIGFLLLAALAIFDIIMVIVNAVKVNKGEETQYPLTLTLVK